MKHALRLTAETLGAALVLGTALAFPWALAALIGVTI